MNANPPKTAGRRRFPTGGVLAESHEIPDIPPPHVTAAVLLFSVGTAQGSLTAQLSPRFSITFNVRLWTLRAAWPHCQTCVYTLAKWRSGWRRSREGVADGLLQPFGFTFLFFFFPPSRNGHSLHLKRVLRAARVSQLIRGAERVAVHLSEAAWQDPHEWSLVICYCQNAASKKKQQKKKGCVQAAYCAALSNWPDELPVWFFFVCLSFDFWKCRARWAVKITLSQIPTLNKIAFSLLVLLFTWRTVRRHPDLQWSPEKCFHS